MATDKNLFLHEEVLLLALNDDKGTTDFGSSFTYAMGGGVLAELFLKDRLACEGDGKGSGLVEVKDPTPVGDPILDEALTKIRDAKRRAKPEAWVSRIAGMSKLKERVAKQLADRGILRTDDQQIFFLFSRKVYPTRDPGPEHAIDERVRNAVLGDAEVDERTATLVGLARPAGLLEGVIDRKELKARKARVEEIVKDKICCDATRSAIEAAQAAAAAAAAVVAAG
jgi:golgi phosphoprotein 3